MSRFKEILGGALALVATTHAVPSSAQTFSTQHTDLYLTLKANAAVVYTDLSIDPRFQNARVVVNKIKDPTQRAVADSLVDTTLLEAACRYAMRPSVPHTQLAEALLDGIPVDQVHKTTRAEGEVAIDNMQGAEALYSELFENDTVKARQIASYIDDAKKKTTVSDLIELGPQIKNLWNSERMIVDSVFDKFRNAAIPTYQTLRDDAERLCDGYRTRLYTSLSSVRRQLTAAEIQAAYKR